MRSARRGIREEIIREDFAAEIRRFREMRRDREATPQARRGEMMSVNEKIHVFALEHALDAMGIFNPVLRGRITWKMKKANMENTEPDEFWASLDRGRINNFLNVVSMNKDGTIHHPPLAPTIANLRVVFSEERAFKKFVTVYFESRALVWKTITSDPHSNTSPRTERVSDGA